MDEKQQTPPDKPVAPDSYSQETTVHPNSTSHGTRGTTAYPHHLRDSVEQWVEQPHCRGRLITLRSASPEPSRSRSRLLLLPEQLVIQMKVGERVFWGPPPPHPLACVSGIIIRHPLLPVSYLDGTLAQLLFQIMNGSRAYSFIAACHPKASSLSCPPCLHDIYGCYIWPVVPETITSTFSLFAALVSFSQHTLTQQKTYHRFSVFKRMPLRLPLCFYLMLPNAYIISACNW